jgi:Na+-driven multidrug efflux pump
MHLFWLYIFVSVLDFSMKGVALSCLITYSSTFVLTYGYLFIDSSRLKPDSWYFLSKDSFVGIIEYLSYGIPSMIM